jgi:hypothetical protein
MKLNSYAKQTSKKIDTSDWVPTDDGLAAFWTALQKNTMVDELVLALPLLGVERVARALLECFASVFNTGECSNATFEPVQIDELNYYLDRNERFSFLLKVPLPLCFWSRVLK